LLQLPHLGRSAARDTSILFQVPQNWQRNVAFVPCVVSLSTVSIIPPIAIDSMTDIQLQKVPQPGDTAPDFTAPGTNKEMVTLSSFRGKRNVLLAFFPLAFTSTCTEELCDFTRDQFRFGELDVEIIPISVDAVPSLRAFGKQEKIEQVMVSDFHRDISRAYGVLDDVKYYSKRSYFLIDKNGIVRWSYVEEHNGLKRSNAEILAEVAKLV
jgi:peroxiredoxin